MRIIPTLSRFQLLLICLLMFDQLHPAFADPIHDGAATDVQMLMGQPPCTEQPMALISRLSQT